MVHWRCFARLKTELTMIHAHKHAIWFWISCIDSRPLGASSAQKSHPRSKNQAKQVYFCSIHEFPPNSQIIIDIQELTGVSLCSLYCSLFCATTLPFTSSISVWKFLEWASFCSWYIIYVNTQHQPTRFENFGAFPFINANLFCSGRSIFFDQFLSILSTNTSIKKNSSTNCYQRPWIHDVLSKYRNNPIVCRRQHCNSW